MPNEILIRFVRGSAWDSKIIEYRTRAWCSHVEAIYPTEILADTTFGAMLKGGVKPRSIHDKIYKHVSRYEIWHIPCTSEQYELYWEFMHEQDGKPYDWRAIVSFALGERDWKEADSWFCSELVTAAGVAAVLWNWPAQAKLDRIDPSDAYLLYTTLPGAHL
jgi:hypothetical protein